MDSVNVRQLKNNPSEALRRLSDGPVLVLKRDEPAALLVQLNVEAMSEAGDVRLALGAGLFKDGTFSLGRAARFARVSVSDFITHLSRLGISVVQTDDADKHTKHDMETLDEWLASS
jgi:antitoxin (DNA-binding transcriptional repressor) of toxin-antitoxin stability system